MLGVFVLVALVMRLNEGRTLVAERSEEPPPPAQLVVPQASTYALAPPETATVDGRPLDLDAINRPPLEFLASLEQPRVVVVPGFVPLGAEEPVRLHWVAQERLRAAAVRVLTEDSDVVLVSGGNVHPAGTPWNEAFEMRRFLIEELELAAHRVLVEPYARHSTTNLRNAGRLLLRAGLEEALVVTTAGQGFYFGHQDLSGFQARCAEELGHGLGTLEALDRASTQVRFRPSPEVFQIGEDPLDP